jgi:predicted acylesterase/phospholipase RssA
LVWSEIKEIASVSIGSVISLLLLIGMTPFQIHSKICEIDRPFGKILPLKKIKKSWGLLSPKTLKETIIDLAIEFDPDLAQITFEELFERTNKSFSVVVTNLSKVKMEIFNHISTPKLRCIDAVIISCNIPFLFSKIRYKGNLYIDGGFSNNLPLSFVTGKRLAIWVHWEYPIFAPPSITDFVSRISTVTMTSIIEAEIEKNREKTEIIKIASSSSSFFELLITEEAKILLFTRGVESAKEFRIHKIFNQTHED